MGNLDDAIAAQVAADTSKRQAADLVEASAVDALLRTAIPDEYHAAIDLHFDGPAAIITRNEEQIRVTRGVVYGAQHDTPTLDTAYFIAENGAWAFPQNHSVGTFWSALLRYFAIADDRAAKHAEPPPAETAPAAFVPDTSPTAQGTAIALEHTFNPPLSTATLSTAPADPPISSATQRVTPASWGRP